MKVGDILEMNRDWLKFAEAKNAIVVLSVGVAIPAIIKLAESPHPLVQIYAYSSISLLLLSLAIAIVSFFPRLHIPSVASNRFKVPKSESSNLIYFGGIVGKTQNELKEYVISEIKDEYPKKEPFIDDAIEQIYVISQIAFRKMYLFRWAVSCFFGAIFTPLAFVILFILLKNDEIQ